MLGLWPETDSELSASEGTTAKNLSEIVIISAVSYFKQKYYSDNFVLICYCNMSVATAYIQNLCLRLHSAPLVNFVADSFLEG